MKKLIAAAAFAFTVLVGCSSNPAVEARIHPQAGVPHIEFNNVFVKDHQLVVCFQLDREPGNVFARAVDQKRDDIAGIDRKVEDLGGEVYLVRFDLTSAPDLDKTLFDVGVTSKATGYPNDVTFKIEGDKVLRLTYEDGQAMFKPI